MKSDITFLNPKSPLKSSTATEMPNKLKYIDALRGLAIIAVLIRHTGDNGTNQSLPNILKYAILNGNSGVALFYFISAYTLMISMHSRVKFENNFIRNFYIRRFFRIAPMFYFAIVYYVLQYAYTNFINTGAFSTFTIPEIFSHILLIHGFFPTWINSVVPGGWSVGDEVIFYLILPFIFYKISTLQKATSMFLITLILAFILDLFFRKYQVNNVPIIPRSFLSFYFPGQLPVFALGVFFYFLVKNNFRVHITPIIILSISLIVIISQLGIVILPINVLFTIGFLILTIALIKAEFKLFINPFMTFIGKISYSMYLSHFAVIYWLLRLGIIDIIHSPGTINAIINYAIRLILISVPTILISSIFYSVIELPMQKFGHRFLK